MFIHSYMYVHVYTFVYARTDECMHLCDNMWSFISHSTMSPYFFIHFPPHLRRPVLLLKVAEHLHGVGDPKNEPRTRGVEAAEVGRQRDQALLQPGQVEVALQDHLLLGIDRNDVNYSCETWKSGDSDGMYHDLPENGHKGMRKQWICYTLQMPHFKLQTSHFTLPKSPFDIQHSNTLHSMDFPVQTPLFLV